MSDSVKPFEKASSVVDVRLEVLNISGRKSGHVQERRARISAYLKSCKDKPDFLSLVDSVAKLHVTTFCAALHERWMGADYKDIAYVWKGNKYVNEGGYRQNHEALLYDSNVWEYLVGNELLIRNQDFCPKLREFLRNRYRAGVFRHKETHKVVYVVTYHGRHDRPDETKQNGLSELVRALLNKLDTAKLSSEPSIFICGDFNFNVGRESYSQEFLEKHQIHLFPQLGSREAVGGSVKAPVDYILTRGPAISISQCYEYNILADTAHFRSSSQPPKELAIPLPIEKLGSDIECLLEKVTEWKRAPGLKILDSECHRGLVRFDVTNLLAEVLEETKTRESTPLKDVFDHNFIHMHAKLGARLISISPLIEGST